MCPVDELELQQEINGTMLLATKLLEANYSADILRFCQIEKYKEDYDIFVVDAVQKILERAPMICSFYTLWPYYHITLRIAEELKKVRNDIVVVFGGPQATLTAVETLTEMWCVDYICSGEGENTIVPFVKALKEQKDLSLIPGLYFRKDSEIVFNGPAPLTDLDTVPYWDERLFTDEERRSIADGTVKEQYMPIDAGRGCPFNCTFCCTSSVLNHSYRLKSAERIVEDIIYYKEKYGINKFWLSHDALTTNKRLVEEICDCILERNLDIKWRCTTRVDLLTEELVLKMKASGLSSIDFGLETGSARMQQITNKRLDLEKTKKMVSFLLKNKIRVMTYVMYGFPEETEEDLNDTMQMYFSLLDAGVSYASMAFCRFLPKTKLVQQYYDQLVIDLNIKKLSRDMFGYEKELPWAYEHKSLFTYYYHLRTPVREKYQFVYFLGHIYQRFPNSIKYLRKSYAGDNLRFFEDFYESNRDCFAGDISLMKEIAFRDPMQMLGNMLDRSKLPYARQLKGLMKYDLDIQTVSKSKKDISFRETYDFSYLEYAKKIPVEQYSNLKTELLIQKVGGKLSVKVLKLVSDM